MGVHFRPGSGNFSKLSGIFIKITEKLAAEEYLGIFRIDDDLGYKNGTMISPAHLRKYVFPVYKKIIEISHGYGKTFILHSCGNLEPVMEDLIENYGIDDRQSYEDVIMPVKEVKKKWGDRIAILGGIDVDFLCRRSVSEIEEKPTCRQN